MANGRFRILYNYNHRIYKHKMACFACRKAFKKPSDVPHSTGGDICPQCGGQLANMGFHFRVPKQKDVEAWQVAEKLIQAGILYQDQHANPDGFRPSRLDQVDEFIADHKAKK